MNISDRQFLIACHYWVKLMEMSYYEDVYLRRLNRYGDNYYDRIMGQRIAEFEDYLTKTVYRVDFIYDNELVAGVLERYKQDETQTLQYLLTRLENNIPAGTILMLKDKDGNERPWMVYYLEDIKASAYNRYIVLKMSHYLKWKDRNGVLRESWAYMYGQEDNMLKDELKSRSRNHALYDENLKLSFFVMPTNEYIRKDDYIEIGEGALKEAYRVTGYDIQSSKGVEYVSVDPIYIYDQTPPPEQKPGDSDEDFYWLNKGEN